MNARLAIAILCCAVSCSGCADTDDPRTIPVRPRVDAGSESGRDAAIDSSEPNGSALDGYPEIQLAYKAAPTSHLVISEAFPRLIDLHINVDSTDSMVPAVTGLREGFIENVVVPLRTELADIGFGVSQFGDFPIDPFGDMAPSRGYGRAFRLLTPITTELAAVQSRVAQLARVLTAGGDTNEAGAEALFQIASGNGYKSGPKYYIEPSPSSELIPGGAGGVGFRPLSLRVVLHIGDAPSHTPTEYADHGLSNTHSYAQASAALSVLNARVVSIVPTLCNTPPDCGSESDYPAVRAELSEVAVQTGAVIPGPRGECSTGKEGRTHTSYKGACPLVYDARSDGTDLSMTVRRALNDLLKEVKFDQVSATVTGLSPFVREVRAEEITNGADAQPSLVDRLPYALPDGIPDGFTSVRQRAPIAFRVMLSNDRIAPTRIEQRFLIEIQVIGDGLLIDNHRLVAVVPPARN